MIQAVVDTNVWVSVFLNRQGFPAQPSQRRTVAARRVPDGQDPNKVSRVVDLVIFSNAAAASAIADRLANKRSILIRIEGKSKRSDEEVS